ncbi:MAG TPA: hypothetical protein VMI54_23535 [Polyangiaceae bacterium]|nr:hypothetical protein [Polyangiaceae bacterium]
MVNALLRGAVVAAVGLVAGCKPDIAGAPSIIDGPRILAIKSEPAEAAPKANPTPTITWSTLFVGPDGNLDPSRLDWALCMARKPLATAGEIAPECLAPSGPDLNDLGAGDSVSNLLPDSGCNLFGPNPPVPMPGEPAPRPTDPDSTGGFYQPLRIADDEPDGYEYAVGLTRISCGLARVSPDQAADYQQRYRPNQNPSLSNVVVDPDQSAAPLTSDPSTTAVVNAGSQVTLRATWPDCPLEPTCGDGICGANEDKNDCPADCTDPHGCAGSEPYVYFDLNQRAVVDRREGMRVSWYSAGGSFEHDRTGQPEADAATSYTDNVWTAPNTPGDVYLWAVLRDDRGGVDWGSFVVHVE